VVCAPAFRPVTDAQIIEAKTLIDAVETVVDSGCPIGTYNRANADLLDYARRSGKTILTSLDALSEAKL
jgi:iron complex transport system ATP-binding protein